ncbi:MAG TPA: hypothetical protein VMI52_13025 [Acetobacteraceae bacterium]|nr:hypothetical protein [Acetobacteraceae bacterium]
MALAAGLLLAPVARAADDVATPAPTDQPPTQPPTQTPTQAPAQASGQASAPAATPAQEGATQVAGLFMATCMRFGPDRDGLRGWLAGEHAPDMPDKPRTLFLAGRSGRVYDVSYQTTRLALLSLDDGSCEAVAEFADPDRTADALVSALKGQSITVAAPSEKPDPKHPTLRHRIYAITTGTDRATVVLTTATQGAPQAIITLLPG